MAHLQQRSFRMLLSNAIVRFLCLYGLVQDHEPRLWCVCAAAVRVCQFAIAVRCSSPRAMAMLAAVNGACRVLQPELQLLLSSVNALRAPCSLQIGCGVLDTQHSCQQEPASCSYQSSSGDVAAQSDVDTRRCSPLTGWCTPRHTTAPGSSPLWARSMSSWATAVRFDPEALSSTTAAPSTPFDVSEAQPSSSSPGSSRRLLEVPSLGPSPLEQLGSPEEQQQRLKQLIPAHEIEPGLPVLRAQVRLATGSSACVKLRKGGFTPLHLFSLPGEEALSLAISSTSARRLVQQYGRNGLKARVLQLDIVAGAYVHNPLPIGSERKHHARIRRRQEEVEEGTPLVSIRVLPQLVHINSVTLEVENLAVLYCPHDRRVRVPVPVVLWGGEGSPGVKAGGWLHLVERALPLRCRGQVVPPSIELDCKQMKLKDVLRFADVPLPPGCEVDVKDPTQPVVRCTSKVGGN